MKEKVYLHRCEDYEENSIRTAVFDMLDKYFSDQPVILKNKVILLKPNLLSPNDPQKAVTTHPEILRQVSLYFLDKEATILVADSPAGPFTEHSLDKVYNMCRLKELENELPIRLNRNLSGFQSHHPEGKNLKSFHLLEALKEVDFIVNLPKLKTHSLTYFTGAVKNLYGLIPGLEKAYYHSKFPDKKEFSKMLVDLCDYIKPDLSIMDGVIGMEGPGPSGGQAKKAGLMGLSGNPYVLDYFFSNLVSLPFKQIPVLEEAAERGFLSENIEDIEVAGEDPSAFKTVFEPAIKGSFTGSPVFFVLNRIPMAKKLVKKIEDKIAPWPVMNDKCIGCEKCKDLCPRQIIHMEENKAVPDYNECIRCYCCHEICPVEAVELVKNFRK